MKQYGIFGGTFNPPHIAHSLIAEDVKKQLNLDKIIFIPSAVPPLKNEIEILEIGHRLAMAKIAFEKNPDYEVSDIEIVNTNEKSYTIDTLTKLHELYKNDSVKFFLILGIDSLIDFPKWKTPEKLFSLAKVVALNRPGYKKEDVKTEYSEKAVFLDTPFIDISSTIIREKVRKNMSIKYLVLPEIEKYIKQNNLYK
ncbi:MAG: nicotinate-nucleotide adenylyltransferase [Ignavibacteria bacterium]|jgi:nicotinate-nucleotide adenylyltransferase